MSDTYGVVPGRGDEPGLPQISLPTFDDKPTPGPLKITVGSKPPPAAPASAGKDPWVDYPDAGQEAPAARAKGTDPWADYPDASTPTEPQRQIGTGEATYKGVVKGATLGFGPAIEGLSEAAGPRDPAFEKAGYVRGRVQDARERPFQPPRSHGEGGL
jgi:hypothetical protein